MKIDLTEAVAITAQDLFESEVLRERAKQLNEHGSVHDLMEHDSGQIGEAALALFYGVDAQWPWSDGKKPSEYESRRERLVAAAACVQAEVARLWRVYEKIADVALSIPTVKS